MCPCEVADSEFGSPMVSNKNRLYVALYPSGVANNDERK